MLMAQNIFKEVFKITNEQILKTMIDDIQLRGLSNHTADGYISKIKYFMKYCDKPVTELTEEDIRQFLKHLIEDKSLASGTVNIYNSALRFLYGVTLNRTLNLRQIPRLKKNRKIPDILTKKDFTNFIHACDNLKYRAIFMTLYGAGLRVSEVTHLRICDVDSKSMRLFVNQGKGSKDRYSLLSKTNLEILREYWKSYKPNHPQGYLFLSRTKNSNNPITKRAVADAFHKYIDRANIKKNLTVHSIRHSFATHLLESGVDLYTIKRLLGHTDISTTAFYLHLANFESSIESPLDNLPGIKGHD